MTNLTPNDLDAQKGTLQQVPQSPAIKSDTAGQHQEYMPLGSKPGGGANLK